MAGQQSVHSVKTGDLVEGEVSKITDYGAFVDLPFGKKGLIHISKIAKTYVKDVNKYLKVGDRIQTRVVTVSDDGKIDLSLKDAPRIKPKKPDFKFHTFEKKLDEFLHEHPF